MPSFEAFSNQELMSLSPLQLAFIGDSVYDLLVRGRMLRTFNKPRVLHLGAAGKVNAPAQARTLKALEPHLTAIESDYVRRGRNARARHPAPKAASGAEYAAATGLETLLGYLYVTGQEERLASLFALSGELEQDNHSTSEEREGTSNE